MLSRLTYLAFWLLSVFIFKVAAAPQPQAQSPQEPRVNLPYGPVVGKRDASLPVDSFLGIPYAATPPKRFTPPVDPAPWKEPLKATEYKTTCPSLYRGETNRHQDNVTTTLYNTPPLEDSEDCLYVNVFAPAGPGPPGGRAVAFWIYGGNYEFGGSQFHNYDGKYLAAYEDLVMVTFNYRTSFLGFTMSPDMPLEQQNLGYLDMRKALDWVQKNIMFFGGDPRKVTIFGISSGAISVKDLVAYPPEPIPFRAAYFQSREPGLFQPSDNWARLARELKCPDTPRERLDCMARQEYPHVHAVMLQKSIRFAPVYDSKTTAKSLVWRVQHGKAANIPILYSAMYNDAAVFVLPRSTYQPVLDQDPKMTAEYAIRQQGGDPSKVPDFVKAYNVAPRPDPDRTRASVAKIYTDAQFLCPAEGLTRAVAATGQKAFRFVTNATFPNTQFIPYIGDAHHTADTPQIWGTYPREGATEQQIKLSRYMMRSFANFVKDPQKGPGWSDVTSGKVQLVGSNGGFGGYPVEESEIDSRCAIFRDAIAAVGG
ncbi:Carboxylesterase [Phyllosticta citriasiana]|uniref:Carboxylic ester hydrolase n=1 Tax=Phyllosticta citriasiana TaxID=595635 RepID=A0ABR1L135_9PEZI